MIVGNQLANIGLVDKSVVLNQDPEKGALTPKSFANIVRLTLNLSFFKNKLVSKARTNLCKAEEFKNNIYGLDVSIQQA